MNERRSFEACTAAERVLTVITLGIAAVLLASCGGQSSRAEYDPAAEGPGDDGPVKRTGPACWGLTEPLDEPAIPLEEACTLVIEQHRRMLDAAFTTYSRDELPVYAGELIVISDLPEHELTNPQYYEDTRDEIEGGVVARIVARVPVPNATPHPLDPGSGLALEIVSRDRRYYTLVMQSGGQTGDIVFSIVMPFGAYSGSLVPGSIDGLSLAEAPERIDFDFDEQYDARGWFYRIRAQGTLFRVDPDDVTPEQALVLDRGQATAGFEREEDGLLRRLELRTRFPVPIPEGLDFVPNDCVRSADYTLIETVDAATLAAGVRDVLVSSTELCCILCRGPECIDSGFRRECWP